MKMGSCCNIFILTSVILLGNAKAVSAELTCDLSVHFHFPDTPPNSQPWYKMTAQKDHPDQPIVKQELEDLYSRGALTGNLEDYYVNFTGTMSLMPGTATWNVITYSDEWVSCTEQEQIKGTCKGLGHMEKVPHCNPAKPMDVYRSIKSMKLFLIPDVTTFKWLKDLLTSPTLRLAYPNNWLPVVVTGGGGVYDSRYSDKSGLHFVLADDVESWWGLPGKLDQLDPRVEIINQDDGFTIYNKGIQSVLPMCDANGGTKKNYSDDSTYKYDCEIQSQSEGDRIQSVTISITGYAFDIPGKFYIGISTEIDPAVYFNTTEPNSDPKKFLPTNIPDNGNGSYLGTAFNVWITVSTPCWSGDGWNADNKCDDVP